MPLIVVTRLRLMDPSDFDEFFAAAVAVAEQVNDSKGNLGQRALADANNVYWTVPGWEDRGSMRSLVDTEPHLASEVHLDDWCDEATFADWEQETPSCPTGRPVMTTSSPRGRRPR
jgi:hypothetical protein